MARQRPDPSFYASHKLATEASPEEPAYFTLLPTASRSLRLALVSVLAALALGCQDSTAPDPPLPSVEAVPELEAMPEHEEPAALVDQEHWADGYVLANNPTAASYTPDPLFSFNRTGGAVQITKPAGTTGRYLVKFTGLSPFLGSKSTVHVTGNLDNTTHCKPVRAYLVNSVVEVRCFLARTGEAVNAHFTVLVLRKGTNLAFAHAHRPTETNYTPQARGSWNPGGAIQVIRVGVGVYRVTFNGFGALLSGSGSGGHVQVSAVGPGKQHCKVRVWDRDAVDVLCYTRAGAPVDTKFNVLYLAPSNRLAYAWADQPSTTSYGPDPFYSTGGPTSITRSGTGQYTVSWAGIASQLLQGGNVQVTAYGPGNAQCNVIQGGFGAAVVACFAPNGARVDSFFTVLLGS